MDRLWTDLNARCGGGLWRSQGWSNGRKIEARHLISPCDLHNPPPHLAFRSVQSRSTNLQSPPHTSRDLPLPVSYHFGAKKFSKKYRFFHRPVRAPQSDVFRPSCSNFKNLGVRRCWGYAAVEPTKMKLRVSRIQEKYGRHHAGTPCSPKVPVCRKNRLFRKAGFS